MASLLSSILVLGACRDRAPEARPAEPAAPAAASAPMLQADATPAPPPEAPPPERVAEPIPPPADVAAPPASAARTTSGVATVVMRKGARAPRPRSTDLVTVHYTGWTANGRMFDSSVQRGVPETLPLASAPRAWREAVAEMTVGERRRLWIPAAVAAQGSPGLEGEMLVYEVELLAIAAAPTAPAGAAPDDATRTATGLAYKRLVAGNGKVHPTESSLLVVQYTGWTTAGEMIESSVVRGRPAERPLAGMMAGWAEALRLMVEGDKMRLWIPPELAYRDDPDKPQGLVVFEIELVSIR